MLGDVEERGGRRDGEGGDERDRGRDRQGVPPRGGRGREGKIPRMEREIGTALNPAAAHFVFTNVAGSEAQLHRTLGQPVTHDRPSAETSVSPKLIEPLIQPLEEFTQPTPVPDEAELARVAERETERQEAEARRIAGHKRLVANVLAASASKQERGNFGPKLWGPDAKS